MSLIACGINHKTTDIAIREQVMFSHENTSETLKQLLDCGAANEAMILSTCNRTEIYGHVADKDRLLNCLFSHPQIGQVVSSDHWYWHENQQAVGHIMRVASGLDSMIIGEPQIFGQMKQAFTLAQKIGTVGTHLQRLLQKVFCVTKQVRTHTGISVSPVSLVCAAVALTKHIFTDIAKCQVLLIGSGQTIELTALHLSDCGVKDLIIANRSLDKAQQLAAQFQGRAIKLEDIPIFLQRVDMVFSATRSTLPILTKNTVESVLKIGKRRPLLMMDMAVPRDFEPQIADLEDVYLYNLDHLQEVVAKNLKSRRQAAQHAEDMIDIQARYFMRQLRALDAVDTIRAYRNKLNTLCEFELFKARLSLDRGEKPSEVLASMYRMLINKIMHTPTIQLHQAACDGELELLLSAKKLFDL